MRIQHNIMAMNAYRNYNNNTKALSKNLERLSSGYKINRAGDDAAGLAISEKMRAQITGLDAAQKNVKDGTSLVNTAEGAMQEIHDMLNRMVYLATQSANGTYDNEVDRLNLQKEVESLKSEINRIADSANFNGIKLLDGTQSSFELSVDGVTASSKSITDGLTINEGANGGGVKASASFDVTGMFGVGDKLTFNLSDGTTSIDLEFGTDFSGDTVEEQAKSIAEALGKEGDIATNFEVKQDGTKITITANNEGASELAVKNIKVTDNHVTFGTGAIKNGTSAAANAKLTGGGFTKLFDGGATGAATASLNLAKGDVLTFAFSDAAGNKNLFAQVTVTDDMIGKTNEEVTELIVDALKDANFIDVTADNAAELGAAATTGTVADESRMKVSDLFDLAANTKAVAAGGAEIGSIQVKAKFDGDFGVNGVFRKNEDDPSRDIAANSLFAADADVNGAVGATSTEYEVTGGTDKFTAGDKISISGTLSDGRTFNFDVVGGKDFDVSEGTTAKSYKDSMDSLKANLEKTGTDDAIKVTLSDGSVVDAGDIFGAAKEIAITTAADGIKFATVTKGAMGVGVAGGITSAVFTGAESAAIKAEITKGADPSAAKSSITFGGDKPLNYGTAITLDGETYELVKDARDVTNRSNTAVVVSDLSDSSAVAKAMEKAINDRVAEKYENETDPAKKTPYTAKAEGDTVTITTAEKGSSVKALEITTPYGKDVPQLSFKLDPDKIKEGSYMTIATADGKNSKTYEFVKAGNKAKSGNIAIEISDFDKMPDSKALGEAFANVAQGTTVDVADDGTVTITANEAEGSIPAMKVSFYEGKGGLKLQIGDTSEEFNQLKVSIGDMHTAAMGIDGINIGTQEGAQAAIDVIRNAINYVSGVRGDLGAISNRLDHTANNLSVMAENIQDAESTIRDTDVANEMMAYTKNNILVQSAQAMLAQANQVPQGVLQLLQ